MSSHPSKAMDPPSSPESSATTNRRRWEHSRLRRQTGQPNFQHSHGGGASLRGDGNELQAANGGGASLRQGGASLREGGASLHGDTHQAYKPATPNPIANPVGNHQTQFAGGIQQGNQFSSQLGSPFNPTSSEFVPKNMTLSHAARTSSNNVGMASDLIKLATADTQSRDNLSISQGSPAYGYHQSPLSMNTATNAATMNAAQNIYYPKQLSLSTISGQPDGFSTPSTVVANPADPNQQPSQQVLEQRRFGGSQSTGNLTSSYAHGAVDLLRASRSSPLPRNSQSPVSHEGEGTLVSGSRDASPDSATVIGSGSQSTDTPLPSPNQVVGVEQTGQEISHETVADKALYSGPPPGAVVHMGPARRPAMYDDDDEQLRETLTQRHFQLRKQQNALAAQQQASQYQQQPESVAVMCASNGDLVKSQVPYHVYQDFRVAQQQGQAVSLVPPMPMGPIPNSMQRSALLNRLAGNSGIPTLEAIMDPDNMPFVELGAGSGPSKHGVVVITNSPFSVTQAEVKAFMGRNSRILNDADEPVHIMMDRVTSKTYDIYVEFLTQQDAMNAVRRYEDSLMRGRQPRLGPRHVEVKLSRQGDLMKQLFPFAKGVNWHDLPNGIQLNSKWSWENFDGFINEEELNMMWKHVENPGRTPFANDCRERIYECMISTVKKYPWYMTSYITIKQRQMVFKTLSKMIRHLGIKIRDDPMHDRLTPQLHERMVSAALRCPGFTMVQKDSIAFLAGWDDAKCAVFDVPRTANMWTHQWGMTIKPGVPEDVVEYYISIIRNETTRVAGLMPLNRQIQLQEMMNATCNYFGYLWAELNYPKGHGLDNTTIAEAHHRERGSIERILRRAFEGGSTYNY